MNEHTNEHKHTLNWTKRKRMLRKNVGTLHNFLSSFRFIRCASLLRQFSLTVLTHTHTRRPSIECSSSTYSNYTRKCHQHSLCLYTQQKRLSTLNDRFYALCIDHFVESSAHKLLLTSHIHPHTIYTFLCQLTFIWLFNFRFICISI